MGKRRLAREFAMQMLFQRDLGGASPREIFATFRFEAYEAADEDEPDEADSREAEARRGRQRLAEAVAQACVQDGSPSASGEEERIARIDAQISRIAEQQRLGPTLRGDMAGLRRAAIDLLDAFDRARHLVSGAIDHLEQIDELIRQQAEHWRIERMPPVDRNVLRLAVYELLYETDVPKLVVVDEAVELAKGFGAEQSGRFVNGLLDGLLKSQSFPGSMT